MIKKQILRIFISTTVATALSACNSEGDEPDIPGISGGPGRVSFKAVSYRPAPGQFVNEMPAFEVGDTQQTIDTKALEALNRGSLVSLGAFGGQITLSLASPIYHDAFAEADFRVMGNSYITGYKDDMPYGSSEPGIVEVMKDTNGNGLPDDEWYMFKGSMGGSMTYVTLTYRPVSNPSSSQWVEWTSQDGQSGYLTCNTAYHDHTYFPEWLFPDPETAEMTVNAWCLPANGFKDETTGRFHQLCYPGYADSFPNNDARSAFSLRDAVNAAGERGLDRVDFIRITTAVIDSNGPLGEASTEVGGIESLH